MSRGINEQKIKSKSVPNIAIEEDKLLTKLSRIVCAAVSSLDKAQVEQSGLTSDQIRDLNVLAQTAKNLRELRIGINGDKESALKTTTTKDLARISARIIRSRANLSRQIDKTRGEDPTLVVDDEDEEESDRLDEPIDGENTISLSNGSK